jgi:hypothetical protein
MPSGSGARIAGGGQGCCSSYLYITTSMGDALGNVPTLCNELPSAGEPRSVPKALGGRGRMLACHVAPAPLTDASSWGSIPVQTRHTPDHPPEGVAGVVTQSSISMTSSSATSGSVAFAARSARPSG